MATDVRARVLLPVGESGIGSADWYASLVEALGDRLELLPLTHFGATDNDAIDAWLSGRLGAPARPRGWQVGG